MLERRRFARARSTVGVRQENFGMNDGGTERTAARARAAALALGLLGALLLLAGTGAIADDEHPGEHRSGRTGSGHGPPHSDHSPRHGGQFFMAPDGFHHLEGALSRPDRFHLYLYDDHTRPIPATPFLPGARAWVQRHDARGNEVGDRVEIRLRPADDGSRLEAPIPAGATPRIEVKLSLKLGPDPREAFFNFYFQALPVTPIGETEASRNP